MYFKLYTSLHTSTSAERPSSPSDNYITVWICISNFIHLFTHQHLQRDLHLHQTTILQSEYVFQTLYISSHINICRETFISTRQLYYSLNMYFKLYTSLHTSTSAERPSSPSDNYITVWICISNFIHLFTHQHLQRDLHLHQITILQSEYVFQTLYISSHINM